MIKNKEPRNPMEGISASIGTHDFLTPKGRTRKLSIVRRSYWITRKLDRKIKEMKAERVILNEFEIVQQALNEFFDKREKQ